jgi:hypothetical protein
MGLSPIVANEEVVVPAVLEKRFPHLFITSLIFIKDRVTVSFQRYNIDTKEFLPDSETVLIIDNIFEEIEKLPQAKESVDNLIKLIVSLKNSREQVSDK